MVEVFKRAFRRAGLPLQMSQGFHPQPRLSFMTALPVGLESADEALYLELSQNRDPREIEEKLILPEGLRLISARRLPTPGPKPRVFAARYEIASDDPRLSGPPLYPSAVLRYTGGKGPPKEYHLSDFVRDAAAFSPGRLRLTILASETGSPKPLPAARALWDLPEEWTAKVKKIATILSGEAALAGLSG